MCRQETRKQEDDQWDQICKVDGNVKFMRGKSWPLWELWKEIFGKDRATGGGVNDYHINFDKFTPDENTTPHPTQDPLDDNGSGQSGRAGSTQKTTGVKRKADAADAGLMEFLGSLHAETNARLEVLSSRIGYEFDLGKARQGVFDKLGKLPDLTLQKFQLCNILGDKSQCLEVFLGIPDDAKQLYALWLIEQSNRAA
ncbi:hypothetical protein AAHA92_00443 [Salvia divinorum]|uniref:Uncharacterized protein n=1 Tax=Salvia divinorum TaxID=28513 RepID=A0ABD1IJJ6_SALDI